MYIYIPYEQIESFMTELVKLSVTLLITSSSSITIKIKFTKHDWTSIN